MKSVLMIPNYLHGVKILSKQQIDSYRKIFLGPEEDVCNVSNYK